MDVDVDLPALFHDLVRVQVDLWNRADSRLRADHGVPMSWVEVMAVVGDTPSCRVGDVAQRLSITVGGTSKLVDRIEEAGLIRRSPNPRDRRSHVIDLTPAGLRRLRAAQHSLADQLDRDLGSAATPEELRSLAGTLSQLRASIPQPSRPEAADLT